MVPRMGLSWLRNICEASVSYFIQQSKNFSGGRVDLFSYFFENVSKRVFSLSKKHLILHDIRKKIIGELLKSNLEKQLMGLKLLN